MSSGLEKRGKRLKHEIEETVLLVYLEGKDGTEFILARSRCLLIYLRNQLYVSVLPI